MGFSTHAEHEAACRRCGQSCHFAVPVNGLPVVVDGLHCKFLVQITDERFECSVYEERFEKAPWCATVDDALEEGLLSQGCPYTRGVSGYRGKTRLHPRLLQKAEPLIRASILRDGVPVGVHLGGLHQFLARTGGDDFDIYEDEGARKLRLRERTGSTPERAPDE